MDDANYKTDLTPIIRHLEHLTYTELKVLVTMFHYGTHLTPDQLQRETGSCMKSIRKAMKSENVRAITQQKKAKNKTTQLILKLIQQQQEADSVF